MRKKRWIKLSVLACVLIAGAFVLLAVFQKETPGTVTARDLRDCELYINNFTCSNKFEMRRVEEEEYRDKIASLVTKVAPFRPRVMDDREAGSSSQDEATAVFKHDKVRYTIACFEVTKQTSLDYVHRENPVVIVTKEHLDERGSPHSAWSWYCTMSAADHAALYALLSSYSGGHIVN